MTKLRPLIAGEHMETGFKSLEIRRLEVVGERPRVS
jgi:hypothetical protein